MEIAKDKTTPSAAPSTPSTPDTPISPLTVFVATLPDKFGRESHTLLAVEKIPNILVLHPYYDFSSEVGKKTLAIIGDEVPKYENQWESVLRKDLFCVDKSDLVIFDLDVQDNLHFLAIAACYNKPVVAVSSNLLSVPVYFSGSVICIVKPKQIADIIKLASEDENFLKLPQPVTTQAPAVPVSPASEVKGEKECEKKS